MERDTRKKVLESSREGVVKKASERSWHFGCIFKAEPVWEAGRGQL